MRCTQVCHHTGGVGKRWWFGCKAVAVLYRCVVRLSLLFAMGSTVVIPFYLEYYLLQPAHQVLGFKAHGEQ